MRPVQSIYSKAGADRLFEPNSDQLAKNLPDLAEELMAALIELKRCPQPDRCEVVIAKLNGASAYVLKLRAAVLRESQPQPPMAA